MTTIDCADEIAINAPVEKVFEIVSDYPNWKKWIPIYQCYLLNSDTVEEGSEIRHQYGYKPIIISNFVRRVDHIKSNEALHETYISGGLIGKGSWHFVQQGNQTIATYKCKVTSNTLLNHVLFRLLGTKAHSNVYKPLLKKLKNYCESQS